MNQIDKIRAINKNLLLVRLGNRNHKNCLRWGSNETDEHINKKLELCKDLKKKKMQFITECIFNNGSRADILSLEDGVVYEVMKTETIEKAKNKEGYYPRELKIIFVPCD